MTNLDAILEVAIGVVLAWLILSVGALEVQNIINALINRRAKFLEEALLDMFKDERSLVEQFYAHPAIQALYKKNILGKKVKPDYIPNKIFGEVALEIFLDLGKEDARTAQAIANLETITQNEQLNYFIKRLLPDVDVETAAVKARNAYEKSVIFKNNAETWFNETMEKASSWYAGRAKFIAFIIGVLLAGIFNVDSIQIVEQLWREPTLRQSLVAQAQTVNEAGQLELEGVADLENYYEDLQLPVGWGGDNVPVNGKGWLLKVFGVLLSGLAAMQGAPFWFDVLRKLMNVKGSDSSSDSNGAGGSTTLPPSAPQPPNEFEPVG